MVVSIYILLFYYVNSGAFVLVMLSLDYYEPFDDVRILKFAEYAKVIIPGVSVERIINRTLFFLKKMYDQGCQDVF